MSHADKVLELLPSHVYGMLARLEMQLLERGSIIAFSWLVDFSGSTCRTNEGQIQRRQPRRDRRPVTALNRHRTGSVRHWPGTALAQYRTTQGFSFAADVHKGVGMQFGNVCSNFVIATVRVAEFV
ncbi:MAG: hypothetical protein ABJZ55_11950 [Fuerstiella sp.]